jgi:hypothetical protein
VVLDQPEAARCVSASLLSMMSSAMKMRPTHWSTDGEYEPGRAGYVRGGQPEEAMMAEDFYGAWHTGVEIDRTSRRWRGFVAEPDSERREYTDEDFETRADAAVAASELLTRLRGEHVVAEGD